MEKQTKVVLDASIVAKWYLIEENRENSLTIRDRYIAGSIAIIVPDLIYYEVANALRYSSKMNLQQLSEATKSLGLYGLDTQPYSLLIEEAVRLALEHNITIYDATYVALANKENAELYTCDKELIRKKLAKNISDFIV